MMAEERRLSTIEAQMENLSTVTTSLVSTMTELSQDVKAMVASVTRLAVQMEHHNSNYDEIKTKVSDNTKDITEIKISLAGEAGIKDQSRHIRYAIISGIILVILGVVFKMDLIG